jgi:hypothetical protein
MKHRLNRATRVVAPALHVSRRSERVAGYARHYSFSFLAGVDAAG